MWEDVTESAIVYSTDPMLVHGAREDFTFRGLMDSKQQDWASPPLE